jgi:hypothetical protein
MGTDDVVPFIPVRGMIVPGANGYDDFTIGSFPSRANFIGVDPAVVKEWYEQFQHAVDMYNNPGRYGTEPTDVYELFVNVGKSIPYRHVCKRCQKPPGLYGEGDDVPLYEGETYKFGKAKHVPRQMSVLARYKNEPGMVGPNGLYDHKIWASKLPHHKARALELLFILQYAMGGWFRTTPAQLQQRSIHTLYNLPVGHHHFY